MPRRKAEAAAIAAAIDQALEQVSELSDQLRAVRPFPRGELEALILNRLRAILGILRRDIRGPIADQFED